MNEFNYWMITIVTGLEVLVCLKVALANSVSPRWRTIFLITTLIFGFAWAAVLLSVF